MLKSGKRVLNFDESVLHMTVGRRYSWCSRGKPNLRILGKELAGLSVLLAVSSEGELYLQYLDGTNTEVTVASFFLDLVETLDKQDPDWRGQTMIVLDNCSSHKTRLVRAVFEKLRVPTMYSAPASYAALPIELLFGAIKTAKLPALSTADDAKLKGKGIKRLTNKQAMMVSVADYLRSLSKTSIRHIFNEQFSKLLAFLRMEKV